MRLSTENREKIIDVIAEELGYEPRVYLFGSRLDDNAKGGDVDLLIESESEMPVLSKARLKMRLEALLNLPVDLLVVTAGQPLSAFKRLALQQGERLCLNTYSEIHRRSEATRDLRRSHKIAFHFSQ